MNTISAITRIMSEELPEPKFVEACKDFGERFGKGVGVEPEADRRLYNLMTYFHSKLDIFRK